MNLITNNITVSINKKHIFIVFFSLINIWIENPFATWWKARKYFKRPSLKFKFGILKYSFPYASKKYIGKILDIAVHDVGWKDKYNTPRHERNPYLWICLFKLFTFKIFTHISYLDEKGYSDRSTYYWEYMLDYLYYSKNLKLHNIWTYESSVYKYIKHGEDGSDDKVIPYKIVVPTQLFSLNKKGLKEFNKLYNINFYEN